MNFVFNANATALRNATPLYGAFVVLKTRKLALTTGHQYFKFAGPLGTYVFAGLVIAS